MNARLPPRTLAPVVFLAVLVVAQIVALIGGWWDPNDVKVTTGLIASVFSVVGAGVAYLAFSKGDYLRTVWLLITVNVLGLLGSSVTMALMQLSGVPQAESPLLPVRFVAVLTANVVFTVALVLMALAYKRSGMSPPSTWRSRALWLLSVAVALGVVWRDLVDSLQQMGEGGGTGVLGTIDLISAVGDLITIALVVPILRVAYLLRGGSLASVWILIAASGVSWLIYDAEGLLTSLAGLDPDSTWPFIFRTLALGLVGLSGFFQRGIVARSASTVPATPRAAA